MAKQMRCLICGSDFWDTVACYKEPDKYEAYLCLPGGREWRLCLDCGHYQQAHPYKVAELERIYWDGYRSKDFRGETIAETRNRIMANPTENNQRVSWFTSCFGEGEKRKVLDVGSGLGIFPEALYDMGWEAWALEPNKDSYDFLQSCRKIPVVRDLKDATLPGLQAYNVISFVHLLEHIFDPGGFIIDHTMYLKSGGYIFIEVPHADEFEYLPCDHDEFNSCHLHFFKTWSLAKIVEDAGFEVTAAETVTYPGRGLKRVYMVGRSCG